MFASRSNGRTDSAGFDSAVDDVFARIASRYDLLCDIFSFGVHRHWKRRVAVLIAAEAWVDLLDSATGTGDILLRVLRRQRDIGRRLVGSDISQQMLAVARQRLATTGRAVELLVLDAHSMPSVVCDSIGLYSISFGLKICHRDAALREAMRVLRPGGRLVVLEVSNIRWRFLHRLYLLYMSLCLPVMGWVATGGDASAYRYLLRGIRDFPSAEAFANELRSLGFENVSFERLSLGIVAIHTACKPLRAAA